MKNNNAMANAMRMVSKMMQEDPSTPEFIRVDFACLDKMEDLRVKIRDASKLIVANNEEIPLELKKEWLEYLQLAEVGIQSFLDAHNLTIPEE